MTECVNCKKVVYGDRRKCPFCESKLDRTQNMLWMQQKNENVEKEKTRLLINELTYDLIGGVMAGMGVGGIYASLQPKVRFAASINSIAGTLGGPHDRSISFLNICMEYKELLLIVGLLFMIISASYKRKRKEL